MRRLTSNMAQIQIGLDRSDIQFRVPTETIELRNLFVAVFLGIGQCGNDRDLFRAATFLDHRITQLAKFSVAGMR